MLLPDLALLLLGSARSVSTAFTGESTLAEVRTFLELLSWYCKANIDF